MTTAIAFGFKSGLSNPDLSRSPAPVNLGSLDGNHIIQATVFTEEITAAASWTATTCSSSPADMLPATGSRSVLMIAPYWPPVNAMGTRRSLRLARRLPALGWDPLILTPDPPGAFSLGRPNLAPDMREPPVSVTKVPALFPMLRVAKGVRALLQTRAKLPRLERLVQIAIARSLLPDHFVEWAPAVIRAARRLVREHEIDAVWTTAPPFGAAVVGALVSQAISRPLVVDYRDPWTQAPRLRPRRNPLGVPHWALEELERAVLRRADGVAYVYPENLAWNEQRFGKRAPAKWAVIPNGYDEADFPEGAPTNFEVPTVLYGGSCYGGRTMQPVLRALSSLLAAGRAAPRLLIHGELDPASAKLVADSDALGELVDIRPRVPMSVIAPKMRGAQALLLLTGGEHKHAVAAKIFDYFLAARPVLAYGPRGSSVSKILLDSKAGVWVNHEDGERALADALERVALNDFPYAPDSEEIGRWSADAMAERTAALLNEVT